MAYRKQGRGRGRGEEGVEAGGSEMPKTKKLVLTTGGP